MKLAQIYCTMAEVIDDLGLQGKDTQLFSRIQSASKYINRRFGEFIPLTEARYFQGNGPTLFIAPVLAITAITNNDVAVTDYDLYPLNRYWTNGPAIRLEAQTFTWDWVAITGRWGKYEDSQALGVSATQLVGATTLTVTDGSLVSPGMVLLVESEQELVLDWGTPSAATSLLDGDISEADEEIVVDNGAEFHTGEVIQLSTEDCFIRAIRDDTLVVTRGWNGTTKAAHLNNLAISLCRTFTVGRGVNGTTAAAHDSAAVSRYLVPEDVNWLARQIAGLMVKKAQSGFAGKVGNAELGETYYFNEFPGQVKEIARNYRIVTL